MFLHGADGRKQKTVHVVRQPNGSYHITTVDYSGNFCYENNVLKKILIDGGYVTFNDTTPVYHFYLQDHQGNNRVVVNGNGTVEQVNHYYPYGALMSVSTNGEVQPFKFNGKELERMHGLDWYDYGARHFDPLLGRWHVMDPLCEKYYHMSPYAYCANNPIRFVDLDGRWYWEKNGNLHAEINDNTKTMADFLGTTQKDVIQILERNKISVGKNGKINIKNLSDLSLNKSSLYVMTSDKSGIVLESEPIEANPYVDCLNSPRSPTQTELAVAHYFWGNGEPADVGDRATEMLMSTQAFKDHVQSTATQQSDSGGFAVDMTGMVFHIGRTPVNYTVHHGSKSSHVDFRLFQYENGRMDSFSDPLDVGIEIPGGTRYDYKLRTVTYYFKPVK